MPASASESPFLSQLRRLRQPVGRFLLQTGAWLALTLAIAGMLVLGGPFGWEWGDALRFAAANWLPWALLTPIVFSVSQHFPVMRGHLTRSVPTHLIACVGCSVAASWIGMQFPVMPMRSVTTFRPIATFPGSPAASATFSSAGRVVFEAPAGEAAAASTAPASRAGDEAAVEAGASAPVPVAGRPAPGETVTMTVGTPFTISAAPMPMVSGQVITGGSVVNFGGGVSGEMRVFGVNDPSMLPVPPAGAVQAPRFMMQPSGPGVVGITAARQPWQTMLGSLALRANVGFAVYFIIAAAAHAMAFYRHAEERERQALALVASRNQAKLDALRHQLHPHFLFNTLNAISTLVHRDPVAADNLIADLGDLLRVSLQTSAHEVTLARELELLDHYLAIAQARLGERLTIEREIDPVALEAYVPTLILQPLVENALRHGIEPRLGPGRLTLRARREGDLLRLTVADDGVGLAPAVMRQARPGIGLANCEERLRTLHGARARLEIAAQLAGGVRAELTLPFRTEPSGAALVV